MMHTRSICLAILSFDEHSGYDIRKLLTEGPFSYFLAASYGSIYPALSRLEEEGLITGRDEVEPGRPARRVFSITQAGETALDQALLDMPSPDDIRSEFLLYAMLVDRIPSAHVADVIAERLDRMRKRLAEFEAMRSAEECNTGHWVLGYAIALTQTHISYLENHGARLVELTAAKATTEAAE